VSEHIKYPLEDIVAISSGLTIQASWLLWMFRRARVDFPLFYRIPIYAALHRFVHTVRGEIYSSIADTEAVLNAGRSVIWL
jgi:hypothetical protein